MKPGNLNLSTNAQPCPTERTSVPIVFLVSLIERRRQDESVSDSTLLRIIATPTLYQPPISSHKMWHAHFTLISSVHTKSLMIFVALHLIMSPGYMRCLVSEIARLDSNRISVDSHPCQEELCFSLHIKCYYYDNYILICIICDDKTHYPNMSHTS